MWKADPARNPEHQARGEGRRCRRALDTDVAILLVAVLLWPLLGACRRAAEPDTRAPEPPAEETDTMSERLEWAIALHGGAGSLSEERLAGREPQFVASLERALRLGADMLYGGASSLDTVEAVVRELEDDPLFNAGKGSVYTHDGTHQLDASIMEGRALRCGAVAAVSTVKNPVTLARRVMDQTPHVLLVADGAEAFARSAGVELVDPVYFHTRERREELERERAKEAAGAAATSGLGTVGAVALDRAGDLAAATSTGGRTNKRFGRVGDVPVIGAGTYADNRTCAVSGTGKGEELIRHAAAASVSARIEHGGRTVGQAVREVVRYVLEPGDGGLIAVGADGTLVLEFNTAAMFRGAADSAGRFEVAIR